MRDYIHVLDLADAHLLALDFLRSNDPRMEIYNLGCGGEGHTIREVVSCAEKVTGKRIATVSGPRRPGDPPVLVASSDKARRELGWKPTRERLDVMIESAWKMEVLSAVRGLFLPRSGRRGCRLLAAGNRLRAELLREPLDATLGVHQLLPAREERVAVRADFQMQLFLGRPGLPGRTAGAPGLYLVIIRMNAFLHDKTPFRKP